MVVRGSIEFTLFDAPVQLPFTVTTKALGPAGAEHVTEVYSLGAKWGGGLTDESKKGYPAFPRCAAVEPADAGNLRMWKTFPTFAGNAPAPASTTAPHGAPGGGGGGSAGAQATTGKITGLQVPGGSFAQDDTQKLQVSGTGGCAFDLAMKRTRAAPEGDRARSCGSTSGKLNRT
jgi:hypothetical protein